MTYKLLAVCTHHISRKCVALLLGYSIWFYLHQELVKTCAVELPLYFLNAESISLKAPEEIVCTLRGKHKFLKKYKEYDSGVYVDAQTLPHQKSFLLTLEKNQIHLPPHVSMVHCTPIVLTIT